VGKLIDRERRARAKEAKRERMQSIRDAAIRSFIKLPYVEISLDAVGRQAGVKKGIASMYFGSKEELFLQILRDELEDWYGGLEQRLGARPARLPSARLARLLAESLADRELLTRLLNLAPVVLEQNMEVMAAYNFQRWQRDRMSEVGAEIDRRCRGLENGDGISLLHRVQLLAAALHPFAHPRGSLAINLSDPDFAVFKVDMAAEIEALARRSLGD